MTQQSNNLDTFKTLFLVKGILTLCFSLFFIFYGCIGFIFTSIIENNETNTELPFNFGWVFVVFGSIGLLLCITLGILTLLASKYIKDIKNYNFIFAISIINCITGILGIVLGIFTIIELTKPDVKKLFNKA
jgi:hypothetical protein